MANNIVKSDDMIGVYELSLNSNDSTDYFDTIAFDVERNVLRGDGRCNYGFMGDEEYLKLITDLVDGVPQSQKYIDLVNGCNYVNSSGRLSIFEGIKEMLKGFVYYAYLQTAYMNTTSMGASKPEFDGGERATKYELNRQTQIIQNKGVDLYNGSCFDYLDFYKSNYSDYRHTRCPRFITNGIF